MSDLRIPMLPARGQFNLLGTEGCIALKGKKSVRNVKLFTQTWSLCEISLSMDTSIV